MSIPFDTAEEWYASGLPIPLGELVSWIRSGDERLQALAYEAATSRSPQTLSDDDRLLWRAIVIPHALHLMATGARDAKGNASECILDIVPVLGAACVRGDVELAADLRDMLALAAKCSPVCADAIVGHGLEHWLARREVARLFADWDNDARLRPLMDSAREIIKKNEPGRSGSVSAL